MAGNRPDESDWRGGEAAGNLRAMDVTSERLAAALSDRYRIERELGAGGMATVYLAEDLKHDRHVAIKVLRPELAAVLGAERFVQEIKTTAALSHPHILPLFDSGEADGFLYYVMPYLEGETIREKLNRETQFGIDEAVKITTEVADALDYAHRNGVIHRDIKPENILLHNGRPMVMDFGIALAVSAAAGGRMTETGLSLGTPHYMSPEQATADRDITARSDIYSLASVLYEMLTGEPPHMGTSAQQIIMKIVTDTPRPVQELRTSAPPHLAAAVATALEKLPADRFHDAASFAAALHDTTFRRPRGTAVDDTPAGAGWSHRQVGVVGAVAVAALVVGATATSLTMADRSSADPARRVLLSFAGGFRPALTGLGMPPDGSGLLLAGQDSIASSRRQFWFKGWNRLGVEPVVGALPDGCCPTYSPSGDSLAYLTRPNWLHVVPLRGGAPSRVTDADLVDVGLLVGGVHWGHDGWLYASARTGLIRMTPAGDSVEQVTRYDENPDGGIHLWPSLLPNGRGVVFTSVSQAFSNQPLSSISVVDLRTGAISTLAQGRRAVMAPTGHLVVAKADGVLWAAPFDPRSLRLDGPEIELSDTVFVNDRTANFAISQTGTLAYARPAPELPQRMVWVERSGEVGPVEMTGLESLVSGTTQDGVVGFRSPRVSPDGKQVAAAVSNLPQGTVVMRFSEDLAPQPISSGPGFRAIPTWRPTRASMSFIAPGDSGLVVYEAPASGAPPRPLDFGERRGIRDHTWSSDGVWLVYRTNDQSEGNGDILAARPGLDTVPRVIAGSDAEELTPSVSPDGRWIAYSSDKSGRHEVYVAPFPDPGGIERPVSLNGGRHPGWNPQGAELFYVDASDNMVAVPVPPGPTFSPGPQRVLFPAADFELSPFDRNYDLSPDGERFLMVQGGRAPTQIVVVFGFDEELRRRTAAR
ncbi:MAG: protein kinase [Gemmatimonadota bacterium]